MGKPLNLLNQTFGYLRVVEKTNIRKHGKLCWICLCSCGSTICVTGSGLVSGNTKSCGCLQKEKASKNRFKDLRGMKFGYLSVLDISGKTSHGVYRYLCKCEYNGCGNIKDIGGRELISGDTKSCGCYKKHATSKTMFKDLTGKRFGNLLVKSLIPEKIKNKYYYCCICDCGNSANILGESLKNGTTKSCGCLKNKGESFIALECKKYFVKKYDALPEYRIIKHPKSNHWLPYDLYIPSHSAYIEIHGTQHYHRASGWHSEDEFESQKKRDLIKKKYALKNGIYICVDLRKIKNSLSAISYIENLL